VRLRCPLAVLVLLAVAVLSGCTGKDAVNTSGDPNGFQYVHTTSRGTTIPPAKRKNAEDLTGTLLTGGAFDLADEKGKVVVLNFWASWCAPCQSESPGLDGFYRDNKAKGVTVIGLDVKDPVKDHPVAFVKDNQISYPIVYDPNGRSALQLGNVPLSIGLPWTVVIDKNQRVAAVYNGEVLPKDLTEIMPALLAEA
jgi:thiol-disulfide isomerase/thioredoxin